MATMWFAVKAGFTIDPEVISLPLATRFMFIHLLSESKRNGWEGRLPPEIFGPLTRAATGLSDGRQRAAVEALKSLGWIGCDDGGLYINGWNKYQKDRTNADRQARHRNAKSNGQKPLSQRNGNGQTETETETETERPPPPPCEGGEDCSVTDKSLRPRDRERYAKTLAYVVQCGQPREHPVWMSSLVARRRRAEYEQGRTSDEDIRTHLAEYGRWVTREKLARFMENKPHG